MKGFIIAVQFLTRLPSPRLSVSKEEFATSMRWFPAVGLLIGLIVTGGAWSGTLADPWVGALVALIIWAGVTGSLHLDGLGDIADACGAAHKDRERLLSAMADPHVGSFAVVTIALQLVAKLVLLHVLAKQGAWAALILIPMAARIAPLVWSRWLPPLHEGLGTLFRSAVRPIDIAIWGGIMLALAFALSVWPILSLLIFIPTWGWWLNRKLGGISGDGHGAGIEVLETGLLFAFALAGAPL